MADMYDDDMGESSAPTKKDESPSETALLPKSFFQGKDLEIGKTCKVRVERLLEDDVEVSYVRHKDKDDEDEDDGEEETEMAEMEDEDEAYV